PDGGFLAYRALGLEVTRRDPLRVTGIQPGEFAPFWQRPADLQRLDYASAIRREDGKGPVLTVRLQPRQAHAEAVQEMPVRVGPRQADVRAVLALSAAGPELALVEWDIRSPRPLTVAAVTGPDVGRWSQSGDRVLVWLKKATAATRLELTGWVPLTAAGGETHLDLPALHVASAARQTTTVRLRARRRPAAPPPPRARPPPP